MFPSPAPARRLFALALLVLPACEGATFGENAPGQDTWLEAGALAVDPLTDTTFVMSVGPPAGAGSSTSQIKRLNAVRADGDAKSILDLDGRRDVRVLFPASGVLVMSEQDGDDRLQLLDRTSFADLESRQTASRYNGTRMSPTRRWIAVADNKDISTPIHVIDTQTLATTAVQHGGAWLEAMWLNQTDHLAAVVCQAPLFSSTPKPGRVMVWDLPKVQQAGWAMDATGAWAQPLFDMPIGGVVPGLIGTMSWIAISPHDHYLAVPLMRAVTPAGASKPALAGTVEIVDLKTSKLTTIADTLGPVAFSADGSTLVAFRAIADGSPRSRRSADRDLVLIQLPTMQVETVPTPFPGGLSFFVTHQGAWVVLAGNVGGQGYVLHDLATGKSKVLSTTGGSLGEFTDRSGHNELWVIDYSADWALQRLDLEAATLATIPVPFEPRHVNWLPKSDRLVLDEAGAGRLHFLDPELGKVTADISLPGLPGS